MDLVNLVVVDSTVNTTSTSTKTSTATTKIKKIKTSKVKANSQKKSVVTAATTTATTTTTNHCPTAINASQLVATKMAAIETVTSSSEQMKISVKSSAATSTATANRIVTEINEKPTGHEKMASANSMAVDTSDKNAVATATPATPPTTTATDGVVNGLKKKSKKMKRLEAEKENISVRSSFSKFDALQKKNLIHVRSSDAGKIQEKLFDGGDISKVTKCAVCAKPVYKMEEIKAEKNIYHRNCFRCHECDKQLSVDTYQSHESVLYCKLHFKILFAPKVVEDSKLDKPRKPELIIRENQPDELPPDVVRASDKPNLGLEELQELNLRSKFQVFENSIEKQQQPPALPVVTGVKRSTSIISKLAKLQSKGFITGLSADDMMIAMQSNSANKSNPDSGNDQSNDDDCDDENDINSSDKSDDDDDDDDDVDDGDGGEETDLVRCRKRTQRERPVGLVGRAMSDIKTKFENGHIMSKEERREERKQELQNIRSRLFLGKQARIKEMYQQAVADSEQLVTSTGKKSEIEIGDKARSLKEKFEKGEIFRDHGSDKEENNNNNSNSNNNAIDDADVFESAISKKSRSMFMELDASAIAEKTQLQQQQRQTMRRKSSICEQNDQDKHSIDSNGELTPTKTIKAFQQRQHQPSDNVVKHDEKTDDVQIETSEISSKFKFFETYRPTENQKKLFRITPPREGVVKLPSPESDDGRSLSPAATPAEPAEQIHTTTIMLNKFREMEQSKKHRNDEDYGPKPLKCFTPPPNDGRRNNQENDDSNDDYSGEDEDDDDDDDDDSDDYAEDVNDKHIYDEALREAQLAARAKKLRDKFEKWEASEIQREMNDDAKFIYADQCADGSTIESTKLIRERFENLNNSQPNATARPRYKVNRFV